MNMKKINDLELKLLLGDNQDIQDAILTIHLKLEEQRVKIGLTCFLECILGI